MQDQQLFDIYLNSEGRSSILRLFAKAKIVFIVTIIWSAINLLSVIAGIIAITTSRGGLIDYWLNTRILIVFIFTFLHVVLLPLQAHFYFSFARRIRESLDEQDPLKFNRSFRLLVTNATVAVIAIIISIAFSLFNMLQGFVR